MFTEMSLTDLKEDMPNHALWVAIDVLANEQFLKSLYNSPIPRYATCQPTPFHIRIISAPARTLERGFPRKKATFADRPQHA
jgi:hypothetical protein